MSRRAQLIEEQEHELMKSLYAMYPLQQQQQMQKQQQEPKQRQKIYSPIPTTGNLANTEQRQNLKIKVNNFDFNADKSILVSVDKTNPQQHKQQKVLNMQAATPTISNNNLVSKTNKFLDNNVFNDDSIDLNKKILVNDVNNTNNSNNSTNNNNNNNNSKNNNTSNGILIKSNFDIKKNCIENIPIVSIKAVNNESHDKVLSEEHVKVASTTTTTTTSAATTTTLTPVASFSTTSTKTKVKPKTSSTTNYFSSFSSLINSSVNSFQQQNHFENTSTSNANGLDDNDFIALL
jgi:hypothetical protein